MDPHRHHPQQQQAHHHPASPAKGGVHAAAHGAGHHHGPAHPVKPKKRRPVAMTLLAVAAAGGIAAWALLGRGPSAPKPEDQLLDQFRKAAAGTVVTPHVFGGELRVDQSEGKLNVVAEALPAPVCVQVGWQLAREGTVVINGVLPQRISGAKLAELCSLDPKGATLLWAPGQQ